MLALGVQRLKAGARDLCNLALRSMPTARRTEQAIMARRARAQPLLDRLSRRPEVGPEGDPLYLRVLVDGMWDNPNYWTRYAFIRAALGLWQGHETGVIGRHKRGRSRDSFARFGIDDVVDLIGLRGSVGLSDVNTFGTN